ncbi:MAG: hypothetical protein RMY28_004375 [Nostoc sp. ChiSLP01]|nr:hypothetical protein [Nostoc sp. CmiSLP01]MDZ8283968.1 hypothetical protein [Nostoc sp. ChiSLP01]
MQANSTYLAFMKILWQQRNSNGKNPNYLTNIAQWLAKFNRQQIIWQQRISCNPH